MPGPTGGAQPREPSPPEAYRGRVPAGYLLEKPADVRAPDAGGLVGRTAQVSNAPAALLDAGSPLPHPAPGVRRPAPSGCPQSSEELAAAILVVTVLAVVAIAMGFLPSRMG